MYLVHTHLVLMRPGQSANQQPCYQPKMVLLKAMAVHSGNTSNPTSPKKNYFATRQFFLPFVTDTCHLKSPTRLKIGSPDQAWVERAHEEHAVRLERRNRLEDGGKNGFGAG